MAIALRFCFNYLDIKLAVIMVKDYGKSRTFLNWSLHWGDFVES